MSDFVTRLEELDKAATPGPWGWADEGWGALAEIQAVSDGTFLGGDIAIADADLIVHLRNHVPEILALVKAARDELNLRHAMGQGEPSESLRAALEALDK